MTSASRPNAAHEQQIQQASSLPVMFNTVLQAVQAAISASTEL